MTLTLELSSQLFSYVSGTLSLSELRDSLMHLRVQKLDALGPQDKALLYAFEVRYAQLNAQAINEQQLKQLLQYALATESATVKPQPDVWFNASHEIQKPIMGSPTLANTATYAPIRVVEVLAVA